MRVFVTGKGDFVLVPAGVPHWFSNVQGTLTQMALHLPMPAKQRASQAVSAAVRGARLGARSRDFTSVMIDSAFLVGHFANSALALHLSATSSYVMGFFGLPFAGSVRAEKTRPSFVWIVTVAASSNTDWNVPP